MTSFGELVLVVGDVHIPERASCIPKQLKRMLVPNKMQHIFCTGNLGSSFSCSSSDKNSTIGIEHNEIYNELVTLVPTSKSIHIVTGDWDNSNTSGNNIPDINQQQNQQTQQTQQNTTLPESVVVRIGSFTIGMIHGHQLIPYNVINNTTTTTTGNTTTDSNTTTGTATSTVSETATATATATETETGTETKTVEENTVASTDAPTDTDTDTAGDATEITSTPPEQSESTPPVVDPTPITSTTPTTTTNDCIDQIRRKLKTGILPNDGNIDIMITGHTHKSSVTVRSNYYHINPGSITGAYTSSCETDNDTENNTNIVPSFILLAIQNDVATCYMYELINDEVIVSKTEFTKQHTILSS